MTEFEEVEAYYHCAVCCGPPARNSVPDAIFVCLPCREDERTPPIPLAEFHGIRVAEAMIYSCSLWLTHPAYD